MNSFTLAMIVLAAACSAASFFFGVLFGRNNAYRTVKTFQVADTHVDMYSAKQPKSGNFS